jgi:hypothetical protein
MACSTIGSRMGRRATSRSKSLPPMSLGWITDMWLDDDERARCSANCTPSSPAMPESAAGPQRYIMRLALAPLIEPDIVSMQRTPPPPPTR